MNNLQEAIRRLQMNNKLVILRTCGSEYQRALLCAAADGYHIVDCSLPGVRMQAEQSADIFVRGLELPVYFANLQYMPSLLPCLLRSGLPLGRILGSCGQSYFLQMEADRAERQDIAFIDLPLAAASAAQQYAFLPTGQMLERISLRKRRCDVLTAIIQGRFGAADSLTVAEYINHALQREVMEHTPVSDNMALYRLLYAAAGMNGTVVNYALLANSVGVSAPTVKQWLQFLAGAGVIYFLQPIADIAGKRLVKAPKLYFRDTAAAAYLLQLKDTAALVSSLHFKNLYENYALNVLREGFLQQGTLPEMKFYRDSNNKEISLLLRWEDMLYPIIISRSAVNTRKLRKSTAILQGYAADAGVRLGTACVLLLDGDCRQLAPGLWQVDIARI